MNVDPGAPSPTEASGSAGHVRASEDYIHAVAAAVALVGRIGPEAWDGPGLGSWDLRSLVGHTSRALSTVSTYVGRPAEIEHIPSPEAYYALAARSVDSAGVDERARQAGADLGSDPAGAFAALADAACSVVASADPDALITTIGGGMRVAAYLPTRTFELVVHGLDVSAAVGQPLELPVAVTSDMACLAARVAADLGHGPMLLRALTGRESLPAPFSVVI